MAFIQKRSLKTHRVWRKRFLLPSKRELYSGVEWYDGRRVAMVASQIASQRTPREWIDGTHKLIPNISVAPTTSNHLCDWDLQQFELLAFEVSQMDRAGIWGLQPRDYNNLNVLCIFFLHNIIVSFFRDQSVTELALCAAYAVDSKYCLAKR